MSGKKIKKKQKKKAQEFNQLSKRSNGLLLVFFTIYAITCVLPLLLVVIISFSSQTSIHQKGYSFFPMEWSLDGYIYLWETGIQVLRSAGISVFVTVFGTVFSLLVMTMFAYVLARPDYKYGKILTAMMVFTMLFSGGTTAKYMVNTQILGLRDSIWVLILPLAFNPFYVVVLRTFLKGNPMEIFEAARIDGAGEFRIFFSIVLPLSKAGIATIALFTSVGYWNDWYYGMMYMFDTKKYPLQTLLQSLQNSMQALLNAASEGMDAMEMQQMVKSLPTESFQMALTVVVILPIMLAYPFFQRYFVKGLTVGGVKG